MLGSEIKIFIITQGIYIESVDSSYYVYEYCNGGNLYDFVRKNGQMSEKQAILFFKQLLNAMKDMVKQNIKMLTCWSKLFKDPAKL